MGDGVVLGAATPQDKLDAIKALAEAVDAKDPYTRGHAERVGVYASKMGRELGLPRDQIERVYIAGLLHDLGKIGIPDAVIRKPDKLTDSEYEVIKQHPVIGARILSQVQFLADVVTCVRHHHEWYDGSQRGYPDRLVGDQIPLPSRNLGIRKADDTGTRVTIFSLSEQAAKIIGARPEVPVYVRADHTLDYGEVVKVMTALQTAGAESVGLITDPPDLS